jgi:hypothetical protein
MAGAAPVDLNDWCALQTPDRCVEGLAYLDENPDREECVISVGDPDRSFLEACEPSDPREVPVTTVPSSSSAADEAAVVEAYEALMSRRLPDLDEKALEFLHRHHASASVTAGLVFETPVDLATALMLVEELGGTLVVAWRTDSVCLPGTDDWPIWTARRFAYLDGVERASRSRKELENSTTPVTGAHIPLNSFAVMEQAAVALQDPGVLIEALQAELPVAVLDGLAADPRISRVRLAAFPTEWFDLTEVPTPDCGSR